MINKKINFHLVDQILFYSSFIPDFVADSKFDHIKINQITQEYIYLNNLLKKPIHVLDKSYQIKFNKFWGLGSLRPSPNFIYEYFKILYNLKKYSVGDLEYILLYLKPFARNALVFSHATKLLHSCDQNSPIVDSKIVKFFDINVYNYSSKINRLDRCLEIYETLKYSYIVMYANKNISETINELCHLSPNFNKLSFTKQIDTIITDIIL